MWVAGCGLRVASCGLRVAGYGLRVKTTVISATRLWHGLPTVSPAPTEGLPEVVFMTECYRIQRDAAVYFVTYSVIEWLPIFISEATCRIITDSLNYCHDHKSLRINGYVVMPTHMHAIVFDENFDSERLGKSLADFRKFTGRSLSDFCAQHMPSSTNETFRGASTADRKRRFWQPSRHPEGIIAEKFWKQKLDYMHNNPCRKGLVMAAHHWRFSSACYYVSDGRNHCDVKISGLNWS